MQALRLALPAATALARRRPQRLAGVVPAVLDVGLRPSAAARSVSDAFASGGTGGGHYVYLTVLAVSPLIAPAGYHAIKIGFTSHLELYARPWQGGVPRYLCALRFGSVVLPDGWVTSFLTRPSRGVHHAEPVTIGRFGTDKKMRRVEKLLLHQALTSGESLEVPIVKTCEELAIPTRRLNGYTETYLVDDNTLRKLQRFLLSEQVAAGFMNFPAELAAEVWGAVTAFMQRPKSDAKFMGVMIRHYKKQ